MKSSTLFKSIATAVLVVVATTIVFGQANPQVKTSLPSYSITLGDTSSITPEYATVGAQMPYYVKKDAFFSSKPSIFKSSGFLWTNTAGLTFTKLDGTALTTLDANPALFADTMVRLDYSGVAAGSYSIGVTEQSRPKNGNGCAASSPRTLTVNVYAKPAMALSATTEDTLGGCSTPPAGYYEFGYDFTVPTVSDSVFVSYSLQGYDYSGASLGTAKDYYAGFPKGNTLRIYPSQLAAVAGGSVQAGSYKVNINGLWDKVSVRAINRDNSLFFTNPLATADVVILVYPTPATSPIKHIKTL